MVREKGIESGLFSSSGEIQNIIISYKYSPQVFILVDIKEKNEKSYLFAISIKVRKHRFAKEKPKIIFAKFEAIVFLVLSAENAKILTSCNNFLIASPPIN